MYKCIHVCIFHKEGSINLLYINIYTYLLYFCRVLTSPDLSIDLYPILSIIIVFNSSSSQSQSFFKRSMNVLSCLTLLYIPLFGFHNIKLRTISLNYSSTVCLMQ